MSIGQIEQNVQDVMENFSKEEFIYSFLLAYGLPKSSITRLRDGSYNLSKKKGGPLFGDAQEILWKKKLFFKEMNDQDLHGFIHKVRLDESIIKHSPRFIIVTDYETLLAYDTKTKDTLDIEFKDLPKRFDFFFPWSGREKAQVKLENPADVKAAYKMAKLYDLIRQDNPGQFLDKKSLHELNVFLSRLLFCYFAEDTEIFRDKLFSNSIESHTQPDGSDMHEYLDRVFDMLNTPYPRSSLPDFLEHFPYVNGGLFADKIQCPKFSARSRKVLIECGSELNWSEINPDIFGSMIQAVVHPNQRSGMGMHYTSVVNIMKVIEPLFLNELYEEFEKSKDKQTDLKKLLGRLAGIRVFDPACGSGNFLVIAYKELRKLEMNILVRLHSLSHLTLTELSKSFINPSQFYGIEVDDFAHEIAILSLWLAVHQMNIKFNNLFKQKLPTLPLQQGGIIVCKNATRIPWKEVCPYDDSVETYILGNPPYKGFLQQDSEQKEDMDIVFRHMRNMKKLDYISCWFYMGSEYVEQSNAQLSFVSTNSITQGEQVSLLWPHIFEKGIEISFAHLSFKWTNNARSNAGVTCVVVGLRKSSNKDKYIYKDGIKSSVKNINGYLTAANGVPVEKLSRPISKLPQISLGSSAYDGGHLMLTKAERLEILKHNPEATDMIKRFIGSAEFLQGIERYCLWIEDNQLEKAWSINKIKDRLNKVIDFRKSSDRKLTHNTAATPHRFTEDRHKDKSSIIVPIVSSERREYYACGFLDGSQIIPNSARAIFDAEPYVFGVLSSKMHMVWVRAVAGQLETRIRYSAGVCYNAFPLPDLSDRQKQSISAHAFNVIEERENHSEKTIAELYDPSKMPQSLKEAHIGLDQAVERCYRSRPFETDEERLAHLFRMYEELIAQKEEVNHA